MWDVVLGIILYCLGMLVGSVVWNDQLETILGTTYSELSSMKRECELVIPRNQECVASIIFIPTASEE